jgi:hypothetical protein
MPFGDEDVVAERPRTADQSLLLMMRLSPLVAAGDKLRTRLVTLGSNGMWPTSSSTRADHDFLSLSTRRRRPHLIIAALLGDLT